MLVLKEFPYWCDCFHKWKNGSSNDVEKMRACNHFLFSGGKGGRERKGKILKQIELPFTHCLG